MATEKSLQTFPAEVLDQILSHVIPFPNQHFQSINPRTSIADAFMAPVTQVCHLIRQCSLELIKRNCIWICFRIVSVGAESEYYESHAGCDELPHLPVVPDILRPEERLGSQCFVIRIEQKGLMSEKIIEHAEVRIQYVPYNFDSFSQMCDHIRIAAIRGQVKRMEIEYTTEPRSKPSHLHHHLLSSICTIRGLQKVTFEVPSLLTPHPAQVEAMLRTSFKARDTLEDAERAIWIADQCELYEYTAEAGLSLLYSKWITEQAQRFLPYPEHWHGGFLYEYNENVISVLTDSLRLRNVGYRNPNPNGDGRTETGNRLRSAVHQIEYRAFLAFYELYQKYGVEWLISHLWTSDLLQGRWMQRPRHMCFGYSSTELAQFHHAKALALHLYKLIEPLSSYPSRFFNCRAWSDLHDRLKPESNWGLNFVWERDALEEIDIALCLEPENHLFKQAYDEIRPRFGDGRAFPPSYNARRRLKVIDSLRYGYWEGDVYMIEAWGGYRMLRHYDLARRGLPDSDD